LCGTAASMGAFLLGQAQKGKGFLPAALRGAHSPGAGIRWCLGHRDDVEMAHKQIIKLKEKMNQLLAKHAGSAAPQKFKGTLIGTIGYCQEAKEYGLVDEIIKNHK